LSRKTTGLTEKGSHAAEYILYSIFGRRLKSVIEDPNDLGLPPPGNSPLHRGLCQIPLAYAEGCVVFVSALQFRKNSAAKPYSYRRRPSKTCRPTILLPHSRALRMKRFLLRVTARSRCTRIKSPTAYPGPPRQDWGPWEQEQSQVWKNIPPLTWQRRIYPPFLPGGKQWRHRSRLCHVNEECSNTWDSLAPRAQSCRGGPGYAVGDLIACTLTGCDAPAETVSSAVPLVGAESWGRQSRGPPTITKYGLPRNFAKLECRLDKHHAPLRHMPVVSGRDPR